MHVSYGLVHKADAVTHPEYVPGRMTGMLCILCLIVIARTAWTRSQCKLLLTLSCPLLCLHLFFMLQTDVQLELSAEWQTLTRHGFASASVSTSGVALVRCYHCCCRSHLAAAAGTILGLTGTR